MTQVDEKALGQQLQRARQAAGLTQQTLCQKAGLSYSTLAKIERGAIKTPSIFTIQSIAAVLGATLDELVGSSARSTPRRRYSKSGVSFIYFDVNGCLVRFYHRAFTSIAAASDMPPDVIETAFWHYNDAICRGDMTITEFNRTLGKQFGLPSFDWTRYYLEAVEPVPGVQELVKWAGMHYSVGLLSNIMPGLIRKLRERALIPDVPYDVIIDSSEVHVLKPERPMYDLAAQRADRPAQEILFVDDTQMNLMAAEKCGWHVMRFDDARAEESVARIRETLEPVS